MAFLHRVADFHAYRPTDGNFPGGMDDSILFFTGGLWGNHDGFRTGFRGKETDTILVCQHILYGVFPTQYPLTGTYQGTVLLLVL